MQKLQYLHNPTTPHNIADFITCSNSKYCDSFLLNFQDDSFKRSRAFILCILTFTCTCISFFINLYEGGTVFFYPLAGIFLAGIVCFLYLLFFRGGENIIAMLLWIILLFLGIFIILRDPSPDHRSLLWISIFPPICILTMGLRKASVLFTSFLVTLIVIFTTDLNNYTTSPLPTGTQLRLLITMTSSFLLIGYVDYSRAKTYEALQKAIMHIGQTSLTDALTGLGNRRYYDNFLEWVMANTKRSDISYAVALLDIDHFKRINDSYGHDVGDDILKHLAEEIKGQVRTADTLFRWGGEEFVIVMPNCNHVESEIAAERIRSHIERTPFLLGNEKIYITISMGIYSGTESNDPKIPMNIADQCLYKAKSSGRNKFYIN